MSAFNEYSNARARLGLPMPRNSVSPREFSLPNVIAETLHKAAGQAAREFDQQVWEEREQALNKEDE